MCARGIDFVYISTVYKIDFGIGLTVWHSFYFIFLFCLIDKDCDLQL